MISHRSALTVMTTATVNSGPSSQINSANNPIESVHIGTTNAPIALNPNTAATTTTSTTNPSTSTTTTTTTTNWGLTTIPNVINETTAPFYFVLYDMISGKVLNILRNTSSQLLNIFETFHDYFSLSSLDSFYTDNYLNGRTTNLDLNNNGEEPMNSSGRFTYGNSFTYHTLASNNIYAKQNYLKHLKNVSKVIHFFLVNWNYALNLNLKCIIIF
jgi:hypothetical protein